MAGLLYNPLFNASMGLLAAGGPSRFPVGFGQALNQGLLQAQGADVAGQELGFRGREADQRDQLFALKQQAIAQEQEQAARQRAAMEQLRAQMTPEMQGLMALDPKLAAQAWAQKQGLLAPDDTSAMQEYRLAVSQGFKGSFVDYKTALANAGRTSIINAVGGQAPPGPFDDMQTAFGKDAGDLARLRAALRTVPPGSPDANTITEAISAIETKLRGDSRTEREGKVDAMLARLKNAETDIANITIADPDYDPSNFQDATLGEFPLVGNYLTSDTGKQMKRAKTEWALGLLRLDTGATITDREYNEIDKTYFPQPGDTAEVIEDKRRARQEIYESMARNEQLPIDVRGAQLEALYRRSGITDQDKLKRMVGAQLASEGY